MTPNTLRCSVCEERRNLGQNAAQWPILQAWAEQKQWPINGAMCDLTADEWKDILTAAFEGETNPRIAPGLNGGMVMLGRRTSKYGKRRFSEWLEWLNAASHHADIRVPVPKHLQGDQRNIICPETGLCDRAAKCRPAGRCQMQRMAA